MNMAALSGRPPVTTQITGGDLEAGFRQLLRQLGVPPAVFAEAVDEQHPPAGRPRGNRPLS
jgi:hypothetical protein